VVSEDLDKDLRSLASQQRAECKSRKVHPTRNRGVLKKQHLAGSRWLTPVILDTQEAEIRRIMV
jgi:hypothetical protein